MFGGANARYSVPTGENKVRNEFYDGNKNLDSISYQTSRRPRKQFNYSTNFGFDYTLNEKNILSYSASVNASNSDNTNFINYNSFLENNNLITTLERNQKQKQKEFGLQNNFSFEHKFDRKDEKISFQFNQSFNKDNQDETIFEAGNTNSIAYTTQDKSNSNSKQQEYIFQTDYVMPIGEKGKFETGIRSNYKQIDQEFNVFNFINSNYIPLSDFTDVTFYNENINAVYAVFGNYWGKLGYQAGLRVENSNFMFKSESANSKNKRTFTDFFPSIHLNYELNDLNEFNFSYSKRIQRPRPRFLIPFSNYADNRNLFFGNPNINPVYIDKFEMGYLFKKSSFTLNPSLFYTYEKDEVNIYAYQNAQGTFISTPVNATNTEEIGGEINISYNPAKWIRLFGNAALFSYKQRGNYLNRNYDGEGFSWNGKLTASLKLKSFDIQILGDYQAPEGNSSFKRLENYGINFAISKDVFKGNGTFTFNINDVFDTRQRHVQTIGDTFFRDVELRFTIRQFNLNFTNRFNQKKKEEKRKEREDSGDVGF